MGFQRTPIVSFAAMLCALTAQAHHELGAAIVELDPADGSVVGAVTGTPNQGVPFTPVASMERNLSDGQPNFTGTLAKRPSG